MLPRSRLFVFQGFRPKKLQGDGSIELGVLSLVDHTHATFAELGKDLVRAAARSSAARPYWCALYGPRKRSATFQIKLTSSPKLFTVQEDIKGGGSPI